MISLSSILNRLDIVFYIIVFAIIYVAIIYLWKKIAQLESSFYKLETTFSTQLLYKNKENTANQFAEDMFMKVFDNNPDQNIEQSSNVEIVRETSSDILEDPIVTEITEILTPSVDDNVFTKTKLAKMSVEQLKEHCGNSSISTEGNKTELINKILAHQK